MKVELQLVNLSGQRNLLARWTIIKNTSCILTMVRASLVPRLSPRVNKFLYWKATESWAGPGNEARSELL